MPVGDDAAAAGYPLVPDTGAGAEVRWGGREINRTRDFIAQVKGLFQAVWPLSSGGTGATTRNGARTNLGIRVGTAAPSDDPAGSQNGDIYFKIVSS